MRGAGAHQFQSPSNRIVAGTSIYTRRVTVPGAIVPCAAVTAVGVVPTHRRRGLLTAMMRRQLELVRVRRGRLDEFAGELETAIAIRTALLRDGTAYVQAGAGIVADSDPKLEYEETLNKARAMLKAVELAETWRKR